MGVFDDLRRIKDASKDRPHPSMAEALKQGADAMEQAEQMREASETAIAGMGGAPSFNPFVNAAALNSAIAGSGVVKELTDTGQKFDLTTIYDVTLEVTIDGHEPYDVVHRQMIAAAALANWQPGKVISLRVDPVDRTKVMLG